MKISEHKLKSCANLRSIFRCEINVQLSSDMRIDVVHASNLKQNAYIKSCGINVAI